MGNSLANFQDRELASVLTTTSRHLRFLDTIRIAESTSSSSFNLDGLTDKMSVFMILPAEYARVQSPLIRLWTGSFLRGVVRAGVRNKHRVHFVLDEAATLGHMECIDDALDKYRKFGVRLQLYYQSLGQLKKCFPDGQDQTVLSNTTQVFFGVNDYQTADYIRHGLAIRPLLWKAVEPQRVGLGSNLNTAAPEAGPIQRARAATGNRWGVAC